MERKKTCKRCGFRRPQSGACPSCYKYERIASRVESNKKKARKRIEEGKEQRSYIAELKVSEEEFARWLSRKKMVCRYCSIPEELIWDLDIPTQSMSRLEKLGVDRIRCDGDYEIGNLSLCCYACNKAKSNQFTDREMVKFIGPGIAQAFLVRLRKARIKHDWTPRKAAT